MEFTPNNLYIGLILSIDANAVFFLKLQHKPF